jgi:Type II CAAX prenyl endopeptidase Rce1-like
MIQNINPNSVVDNLVNASDDRIRSWFAPHRIVLIIAWLFVTFALVGMLWQGVRETKQYPTARYILTSGYVVALIWYLIRSGPSFSQLPEIRPYAFRRWRSGVWIPVLVIALIFTLTAFSDYGVLILDLLMLLAAIWIIVAWRREISLRLTIQGVGIAAIAFFAGRPLQESGLVSVTGYYQFTVLTPFMYVAGGLLFGHTKLGGIQLLAKQYLPALRSFLWGCLLFIPLGLANAASRAPVGVNLPRVSEWWMPFTLPWWSGIVEETWFRLFLVGMVYWMLRPAFSKRPALAVLAAVLFSGITFGLGHGRSLDTFLFTGLLYGVPFAVIFTKRDWEHAVAAHYMVNLIPWVMVLFET